MNEGRGGASDPGPDGDPGPVRELRVSNADQMEILRAVLERGAPMRTTVLGFSMHPFVRDGDAVTVAPLAGEPPRPGDVLAAPHPDSGRLIMHRAVGVDAGGVLLRGDSCGAPDGVVPADRVLGRVVRIERGGREIRFGLGPERRWIARLSACGALILIQRLRLLPALAARPVLAALQSIPLVRRAGRRFARSVAVRRATAREVAAAQRRLAPFGPFAPPAENPNVASFVALRGRQLLGFAQLVRDPDKHSPWRGHWLFSMHVWEPYRGMGIGRKLAEAVLEAARADGAPELFLAVRGDNRRAIRLYRTLGFAPVTLPALDPLLADEARRGGKRRIVMRRDMAPRVGPSSPAPE